jgi:hypothetical protein
MQGNDIADFGAERYNIVVLEPTLVYLDGAKRRRRLRRPTIDEVVECYRVNELMGRWIHQQGYVHGTKTGIWGFGDTATFVTSSGFDVDTKNASTGKCPRPPPGINPS